MHNTNRRSIIVGLATISTAGCVNVPVNEVTKTSISDHTSVDVSNMPIASDDEKVRGEKVYATEVPSENSIYVLYNATLPNQESELKYDVYINKNKKEIVNIDYSSQNTTTRETDAPSVKIERPHVIKVTLNPYDKGIALRLSPIKGDDIWYRTENKNITDTFTKNI